MNRHRSHSGSAGPPSPVDGGGAGATPDATPESSDITSTLTGDPTNERQQRVDVLVGLRDRREHALRTEGGDPDYPGDRRYHRPSSGLRASGFRCGFACGGTDALRRIWPYIAAEHRGDVARIAADYQGGDR
ncbi:hypothetical protein [Mycobacterium sp. 23]|uniref:hypothetical protein n=1 Tax=Mycobacterium sp. 23 TaxID=3400424 RepID=UPI003AB06C05